MALPIPDKGPKCALYIADKNVCMTEESLNKLKKAMHVYGMTDDNALSRIQELVGEPDEISLLKNPKIKALLGDATASSELAQRFRPEGPAKGNALLSNFDVDGTLYQYALAYRGFMPISYGMIDFKQYDSHLAEFSVKDMLKKGFNCAGCVINTDTHDGHGKHWICVFVDCRGKNWQVESFNSSGKPPRKEILDWMAAVQLQLVENLPSKAHTTEQILIYGVQHQKGDSECGVYALYYIWARLNGFEAQSFLQNIIPDQEIEKFRGYLFR